MASEQNRLLDQVKDTGRRVQSVLSAMGQLDKTQRLLAGVADITQVLLAEDDLDAGVAYALRRARALTGAQEVELGRRIVEDGRELYVPYAGDPPFDNPRMKLDLAAVGASAWLARFRQGRSVRARAEELSGPLRQMLETYGAGSVLFLPVPDADGPWGVVGFSSEESSREWSRAEEALLSSMAASLGAAFCRARLARQQREQERLSEELRKAEALTVLARGLAHDFGNVIQSVEGSLEVLRRRCEDEVPRDLEVASRASERAMGLVGQLRVLAGIEKPRRHAVDLASVARESVELLRPEERAVPIEFEVAAETPWVVGDQTQLGQVVTNLVRNACEAVSADDGKVLIRIWPLHEAHRERWAIAVKDNGVGMSPETRRRVLEPFFSSKGERRGLGLSLVSCIVEMHDGQLEMRSEVDRGTEVKIVLPAAPEHLVRR